MTLVPGQTLVIEGQDWPVFQSVVATICGADAISGTADCAVTDTATMVATHHGLLYSRLNVVTPPQPCPCVVLLTSTNSGITSSIPVHIQGAATVPVHRLPANLGKSLEITQLRVSGPWSLAGSFGASASRTVSFDLENPGQTTVRPVLIGRWGAGRDPLNVITMPRMRPLGPGQTRRVVAKFNLGALSIGGFDVKVQVQGVGYPHELTKWSKTTQWPVALFVCLGLLLFVVVTLLYRTRRRGRTRAGQVVGTPEEATAAAHVAGDPAGPPTADVSVVGPPAP